MIFIDANIPMYRVGRAHPNKAAAERALLSLLDADEILVCDAEVYQEVVHRYLALRRPEAIVPAVELLSQVTDRCFDIEREDVLDAVDIAVAYELLSARDALHLAIMRRYEVRRILTFDTDFDRIPFVERIPI